MKQVITHYFFRVYAIELGRAGRRRGWGPFAEAVFQTMLLVCIPMTGVCAAAIVFLGSYQANYHWLMEYRSEVTVFVATFPLLSAFLLVKALVWSYKGSRMDAPRFDTKRDRIISNLQFWAVLLSSIALPWVAAACVHIAR